MRPAVKMLLVACGFAALVARCGPAAANEPPNRFRILFKDGVAAPADDGRVGEQNRQAIRRMAQMLSVWPAASPLTFIFVAPKASVCGSDPSCNPDQMLWQRTMATQSAASQAAKTLGLSFKFTLMRQDFIEAVTPWASRTPPCW